MLSGLKKDGGRNFYHFCQWYALSMLFIVLALQKMPAQQPVIRLERCNWAYIDPQNVNQRSTPDRDSLVFTQFFNEDSLLKAFYVDINSFAGQQVDRTRVFAILPDSSKQLLGEMTFGNCTDCVEGFALVHDGRLETQGINNRQQMDRWLQGFAQPPFRLPGNLQTMRGAGRISGRIPFCAIGWQVEYSVYNSANVSTTKFSTYIFCPEIIASCPLRPTARLDCANDSLHLAVTLPESCFSERAKVRWSNAHGFNADAANVTRKLSGHLGMYYLEVEDAGCIKKDSVLAENPPFAVAGADTTVCIGEAAVLAGHGGQRHFWETPAGRANDSLLLLTNLQPAQSGVYILHAFDAIGCEDTDTLRLSVRTPPAPEVFFEPPCLGDTVVLQVRNDTAYSRLQWVNPRGRPLDPPQIQGFQPADDGTYTLSATDAFGCKVQTEVLVRGSRPPELRLDIREGCDSTRVALTPTQYRYVWADGSVSNTFASAIGGEFKVTVTDPAGCATVASVTLPKPNTPAVEVKVTQPRCPGDGGAVEIIAKNQERPLIFSIDGGKTYSLDTKFNRLPYGEYRLVVQDALGCEWLNPVRIVPPDSMGVSLNLDSLEVRPGTPVKLIAETVGNIKLYQWLPQEIDSGAPATEFTATTNLNIRLVVEDTRGCRATDGFFLRIVLGEVFAPNAFSPNGDGSNERFTLYSDNGSGEIIEHFRIFDRWGNLLFERREMSLSDETQGWDGSSRGKPAPPGVYTYAAVVRFGNGARKLYAGDVTLIR